MGFHLSRLELCHPLEEHFSEAGLFILFEMDELQFVRFIAYMCIAILLGFTRTFARFQNPW